MRWSPLASDLVQEPTLFDQLISPPVEPSTIVAKWAKDDELRKAIEVDFDLLLA